MGKLRDLTGERFGRLTVKERAPNRGQYVYWKCVCDCGREVEARSHSLLNGSKKSCGCYQREVASKWASRPDFRRTTHGMTHTRLYRIHKGMMARCYNKNHMHYRHYGGRGIKVCEEWKKFENFAQWASESGYAEGLSIERIDNDGNYCPENCTWIPVEDQPKHRRTNTIITVDGEQMTLSECSRRYGIPLSTVIYRSKHGWDVKARKRNRKVRCVETGKVYDSVLNASESTGISRGKIYKSLENPSIEVDGYHWIDGEVVIE